MTSRSTRSYKVLCGALLLYSALLLVYTETLAFTADEGFHLITARLIQSGERPYLDFVFPQAPFNAYVNAAWMSIFGSTWRSAHALAALFTVAAVFLIADFVFTRVPASSWRLPAGLAVIFAFGLNAVVVEYGPVAQAYGICLFATAAAFRFSLRAARGRTAWWPALAGFCAAMAAASSLLTASVAPILLVWILIYNRDGNRWKKLVAFAPAALVPFTPVLRLATLGPRQVWFNLVQYHLEFRRLYWPDTFEHDLDVVTSWIDSGQALLLILLACGGLAFLWFEKRGGGGRASAHQTPVATSLPITSGPVGFELPEIWLSAWLAAGIAFEVSLSHPTLPRYFLLAVPFAAIPAVVGLYAFASKLALSPSALVLVFAALSCLGLGKSLYQRNQDIRTWTDYERMAAKVNQVTASGDPLYANEVIYFLTNRRPPSGMEFGYSHKVELPTPDLALFHIVTEQDLTRRLDAGQFPTALSCEDDEVARIDAAKIYMSKAEISDCTVFWGVREKASTPEGAVPPR